jgi:hypothetical protein
MFWLSPRIYYISASFPRRFISDKRLQALRRNISAQPVLNFLQGWQRRLKIEAADL